ncbi:TetR/AcrR family transcriptional regulator [Tsukamurella pseudospumae]|uniref:TetR family transcriptional regulator n=1 Tax=Tsukamurella pseudospumae TaxID=239498 RepID=A0A137ZXT5_9ACTN|nr:TetR/AcrR family transcriptional regulator [Tsukamurella pseudospumae]KXO98290.1 TetR family transcriptional regulator [Tsukamurella pseudospumae]KXP03026.1 TetR family transcriptional regulator [Tsukamurella pseudospumae]
MARLTRIEQRAQTRADLLLAARDRFLEVGYAAASLEDIADRAGYSKGAVYSNFVDKPNLCREVLQAIHEEKVGQLSALVSGPGDLQDRIDVLASWVERTAGDVGWTMLELEFVTVARTDPSLLAMVVELRSAAHRTVVDMLRTMLRGDADDDAADAEAELYALDSTADLMLAAAIGLGIQRAVDPTISPEPVIASLRSTLTLLGAGVY